TIGIVDRVPIRGRDLGRFGWPRRLWWRAHQVSWTDAYGPQLDQLVGVANGVTGLPQLLHLFGLHPDRPKLDKIVPVAVDAGRPQGANIIASDSDSAGLGQLVVVDVRETGGGKGSCEIGSDADGFHPGKVGWAEARKVRRNRPHRADIIWGDPDRLHL